MNGLLFDTNIPSEMMRRRPEPNVMEWLELQASHKIFISAISLGELRRGVTLLAQSDVRRLELERMIQEIIPLWFQGASCLRIEPSPSDGVNSMRDDSSWAGH